MFPDGRRVVSGSADGRAQAVGRGDARRCLATLEGHCDNVRCGVHCTFVMTCLRRRSHCVAVFRTGGASCLRARACRRSRCGDAAWRPANAWRRWKGTRIGPRRAASTAFVMICLRRRSECVARPDGRRVDSARGRQDARGVGRGDRECLATLEGHSSMRARRPLYFCDDLSSS